MARKPASAAWALPGMFAIGLVVGTVGCLLVTQRPRIRRLAGRAVAFTADLIGEFEEPDASRPVLVKSNRRPKAATEVNQ